MLVRRSVRSRAGNYASSALLALLVAGLLYVGVLLLADSRPPEPQPLVQGAIRLAQPEPEPEDLERPDRPERPKPPQELPKTFTAPRQSTMRPQVDLNIPAFDPALHPALSGGLAMPPSIGGGAGFRLDEVDEVPRVVRSVQPEYPFAAKKKHIEGQVVVRMLVTSQGKPEHLSIHSSEPPGVFDQSALAAAKRWRFQPGRYAGQDVDTWVLLPFNFELVQ